MTTATRDRKRIRPAHVAEEAPRDDARADHQPDELERLGDGGGDAPSALVEAELLVVEQGCQDDEADQRGGEEREAPPQPLQRVDLLHGPPALGERRRGLLRSTTTSSPAPVASALPAAARRLDHPEGEQGEQHGGHGEHEERHAPPEREGQQAGGQRADEAADGVRRPVRAEDADAGLDRVVVGEQRVVRRVDDRLADAAPAAGDDEHDHADGQSRHPAEDAPNQRTGDGQRHAPRADRRTGRSAPAGRARRPTPPRRVRGRSWCPVRTRRGCSAGGCRTPCGRARRRRSARTAPPAGRRTHRRTPCPATSSGGAPRP